MKAKLKNLYYRFLFNFTSPKTRFTQIYKDNYWTSKESISGPGSDLDNTVTVRKELPQIFIDYKVKTFLDLPCGDFHWIKLIDLSNIHYIGGDIVDDLIKKNLEKYKAPNLEFKVMDLIKDPLPKVDMIMVRDCFIHLSNPLISKALANIKASGSTWLLTNSFVDMKENINIKTGTWRRVNFDIAPFNLPKPVVSWEEKEHFNKVAGRKFLVLYKIADL
jgi:hypothetical protein